MGHFSHRAAALATASLALLLLPAPALADWSPPKRISDRALGDAALAVDADGHRHVVARGTDGLWYLTDRSGRWTERRLTRDGPEVEYERLRAVMPDIDIDPADGTLVIAWIRQEPVGTGGCSGDVRFRTLRDGQWSATRKVPAQWCAGPVDVEMRNGRLTFAAALSGLEYAQIELIAGLPGDWSSKLLGDVNTGPDPFPMRLTRQPSLELDARGRPSLAYEKTTQTLDSVRTVVRWAHTVRGWLGLRSEAVERYVGEAIWVEAIDLVLDAQDGPRIAWTGPAGTVHARRTANGWSMDRIMDRVDDLAIAINDRGRTRLAVTDRDGVVVHRRVAGGGWPGDVVDPRRAVAIAGLVLETDGDLHLAWQRGTGDRARIWVSRDS